jgi:O-6-methylguanine DNA methyltransferase
MQNAKFKTKSVSFTERVLEVVRRIPAGKTMTYREVAAAAGRPGAARAVGFVMKHNYDPAIPCHRVIRSDGKLGGYNRGVEQKLNLLRQENAL